MRDIIAHAQTLAVRAHYGLVRPNIGQEPYHAHLEEVARLVADSGGSVEEIAAAWLHDAVEDTSLTLAEIIAMTSPEVGVIVEGLTDLPDITGLPIFIRKSIQATRMRTKSDSVKRVKLADQISNVHMVAVDPPTEWGRHECVAYTEGAHLIAETCSGISEYLDTAFETAYQLSKSIHR